LTFAAAVRRLASSRRARQAADPTTRIAYLTGTYPAVSHTFIGREVAGLRELGVDVHTFSVRRPPANQLLTEEARRTAASTPSIQPPNFAALVSSHRAAVSQAPVRYMRTLWLALRLSPGGWRATVWHYFYFVEAIVLWDWIHRRRIKHVHVHFANAATAIAMLCAEFGAQGTTWSFTMHGPTEFDNVDAFLLAEKVSRARFVVCISDYARSQLMKLTAPDQWQKLVVVRCGVDPGLFSPRTATDHPTGDLVTVLCVGRLVPEKGQALLLEALSSLPADTARRIRTVIVGDGPERANLERRAAELDGAEVSFTGAVGEDRLRSLYADADIFCLPSLAEGLPVVLIEAMAMALPVISTRIMGIPELVTDRVHGLLLAPGRADQLAAALRELLDSEELRRSLGTAGRERVMNEYDIRRSVTRLSELYSSVMMSAPPSFDLVGYDQLRP
jgi:colanic acid/amylovoran biosynthesis glycosyltransferase